MCAGASSHTPFHRLCGLLSRGIANLACFHTAINDFETQNNIVRGMNGSEVSAMVVSAAAATSSISKQRSAH